MLLCLFRYLSLRYIMQWLHTTTVCVVWENRQGPAPVRPGNRHPSRQTVKEPSRFRTPLFLRLAADIYASRAHFVLELLQNADDNEYAEGVTLGYARMLEDVDFKNRSKVDLSILKERRGLVMFDVPVYGMQGRRLQSGVFLLHQGLFVGLLVRFQGVTIVARLTCLHVYYTATTTTITPPPPPPTSTTTTTTTPSYIQRRRRRLLLLLPPPLLLLTPARVHVAVAMAVAVVVVWLDLKPVEKQSL